MALAQGTGWIDLQGFGRVNPRRDNAVDGGRQYFDAMLNNGERDRVKGDSITGGPETWHFEIDQPFYIADRDRARLEVTISLVEGASMPCTTRRPSGPNRVTRPVAAAGI